MPPTSHATIAQCLDRAGQRRSSLHDDPDITTYRLFHGASDGVPGLFIDRYGPGCTLVRYVDLAGEVPDAERLGKVVLDAFANLGVTSVYDKPFVRDRSAMSGREDAVLTDPAPIAGESLPDSIIVREPAGQFEVHLHDGFSTGLFLDQRDNRAHLCELCTKMESPRVLNLFAYTGTFSVPCGLGGAEVSTVDVSARYLDWAKRNFAHNQLDPDQHHFARMDARQFLDMARRKGMRFDLVILDPPTFGAADKKRNVRAWSSVRDYPELLRKAREVLTPDGLIFASTNTAALCEAGAFDQLIRDALGARNERIELPKRQIDFPVGDVYPATRLLVC